MLIVARITLFVSVLLCVYLVFGSLLFVDRKEDGLPGEILFASGVNISAVIPSSNVKTLYLYVMMGSSDSANLVRLVRLLGSAGYPGASVELVIVSSFMLNASGVPVVQSMNWSLGVVRVEREFGLVANGSMVVFFEDFMEVSPLFSFWFLLQWDSPVVLGGTDLNRPAGLAVDGRLWNRRIQLVSGGNQSLGMFRDFLRLCGCAAVCPLLEDARVFVRNEYQSPVLPELQLRRRAASPPSPSSSCCGLVARLGR
jgi:hypothetical protein